MQVQADSVWPLRGRGAAPLAKNELKGRGRGGLVFRLPPQEHALLWGEMGG